MGCGRVGSTLARSLEDRNHTVRVIDSDPDAFRRLGPDFNGDKVTGYGFDQEVLEKAGIERADAFAAVSSGDNSNIIAARVARETFGIQQVVARIYDPGRAEVYQRLGITTVATVKWTADQVLRRLLPAGAEPDFRDPSGTIRVDQVPVPETWVGHRTVELPGADRRAGSPGSTGSARACCPTASRCIQEGDLLHLVMREENAARRLRRVIDARTRGGAEPMRVAIAGAGAVGPLDRPRADRATGTRCCSSTRSPRSIKPERVPDAEWLLADSCELSSLEEARLDQCDVVIAATGDDKANLVTSLLAKTEFGVPRTVARVNHPNNEWLFTEAWGVDVNVSTPRIMSALVEEAVTVGDLVRLFTFRQGNANLVELTLPADSPYVGKPAGLIPFPENCALVTILRDGQVYMPDAEQPIEAGDELLFVVPAEVEDELERLLAPGVSPRRLTVDAVGSAGSASATGVRLRPSSHTIAASAASCSGQPMPILSTPSDRRRPCPRRSTRTCRQPDRPLDDDPQEARQRPAAR